MTTEDPRNTAETAPREWRTRFRWLWSRPWALALLGILALGAFVRLWELGTVQVLWFDEITSYYVPFLVTHGYVSTASWGLLRTSVPSVVTRLYQLTYSTITGMTIPALVNTSDPVWLRLPSVCAGVALIALLYGLGAELFNRRVGLAAAFVAAVVPWTVYWSRFAGVIGPLELWPVAAVYAALVAVRLRSSKLLLLSLVFGAFTVYTHEAGIVALVLLILPFWWLCARRFLPEASRALSWRGIEASLRFTWPFLLALAAMLVPLLAFELQPATASTSLAGSGQLVWQQCGSLSCTVRTFFYNSGLSWSPDFFAISGGVDGAQAAGFQTHISIGGAWQSGGGLTGMLTGLGLLVYPALILLALRWPRRWTGEDSLVSWLAVLVALAYTAVGGVVYFDNPNAARLAFSVGFLIVFVAWLATSLVEGLVGAVQARWRRPAQAPPQKWTLPGGNITPAKAVVVSLGIVLIVAPLGGSYLYDYFTEWPAISATYLYPQIEEVGAMLTADGLWDEPLVVQCPSALIYILPAELAFYDPYKPPLASISVFNGSIAANTGPLSSSPSGLVFVSMVNSTLSDLLSSGVPAATLRQSGDISSFWISGSRSAHTEIDSVSSWVNVPSENYSAGGLPWVVESSPVNGSLTVDASSSGLRIVAELPTNATQNTTWSVGASLPARLPEPNFNFLAANWTANVSAGAQDPTLAPLYWNGTANVSGAASVGYPGAVANVADPEMLEDPMSGLEINGTLAPGTSVSLEISNFSAHGLTAAASLSCVRPQSILLGSAADVAVPSGTDLNYTDVDSTLTTSLCLPPVKSNAPTTFFVVASLEFVTNLSAPLELETYAPGYISSSVNDITAPPGTETTLFLSVVGIPSGETTPVKVFIHLGGTALISGLSLIQFTGGPPTIDDG